VSDRMIRQTSSEKQLQNRKDRFTARSAHHDNKKKQNPNRGLSILRRSPNGLA
jgi:hypothetical protein